MIGTACHDGDLHVLHQVNQLTDVRRVSRDEDLGDGVLAREFGEGFGRIGAADGLHFDVEITGERQVPRSSARWAAAAEVPLNF